MRDAGRRSRSITSRADPRGVSARTMSRSDGPCATSASWRRSSPAFSAMARCTGARSTPRAEAIGDFRRARAPVDDSLGAQAVDALKPLAASAGQALPARRARSIAAAIGCCDPLRPRPRGEARRCILAASGTTATTAGRPSVRVPVLSNAIASPSEPLEVHTAFDQHATPRAGGERRHVGNGRRNHQRAGAGNHQQHEGAV